jgi:hypothetical protein
MKKRDFLGEGKQLLCVKEEGDGVIMIEVHYKHV